MTRLTIFTDGSCLNNPGPCGWAWHCVDTGESGHGGFRQGTNNEAEMTAVLMAIGAQQDGSEILIVTDSDQVIGFLGKNWKSHSNPRLGDLQSAIRQLREAKRISMFLKKVKGHDGLPGNEKVDLLARQEAQKARHLPVPDDEFGSIKLELVVTNMDILALRSALGGISQLGAAFEGVAYAYDTKGMQVASANITTDKIDILRAE
jgi:ribonuclease HI